MTFEIFAVYMWLTSTVCFVGIPMLCLRQNRLQDRLKVQEATIETLKAIVADGDPEAFQRATKQLGAPKVSERVPKPEQVRLAEIVHARVKGKQGGGWSGP